MLRYTEEHEWLKQDGEEVVVGITEHAAEQLGDLVFIELPAVGRRVGAGEACAVVESVKAASDVYAPLAGEIVATNADAVATPEAVNQDAFAAWLFRIKPTDVAAMDALLDARGYQAVIGE
jgi:glycine cleavage system H protein